MKNKAKIAMLFATAVLLAMGTIIANTNSATLPGKESMSETTTEDYSDLSTSERVQMLTDMKAVHVENNNMAAASYLEDRINDLNN